MRNTIDMAREAGLFTHKEVQAELKAFEALVRADERALAAPVQEPVAWGNFKEDGTLVGLSQHPEDQANWVGRKPLYTTLPAAQPAFTVQEPVACVACEGNPKGENIPCAVCGATPPAAPYVASQLVQEPVATLIDHYGFTDGVVRFDGVENMEQLPIGTKFYIAPPTAPVQEHLKTENTLFQQFMSEADKAGITHWPTPPEAQRPVPEERKWVGLTDKEVEDIVKYCEGICWDVAEAIEAKLKEKNSD